MEFASREPGAATCCGLPTPPRPYRYVPLVLIVIVIVLWVRYGITVPLPGIVVTGGAGYAVTIRVPRFRFVRARLV